MLKRFQGFQPPIQRDQDGAAGERRFRPGAALTTSTIAAAAAELTPHAQIEAKARPAALTGCRRAQPILRPLPRRICPSIQFDRRLHPKRAVDRREQLHTFWKHRK